MAHRALENLDLGQTPEDALKVSEALAEIIVLAKELNLSESIIKGIGDLQAFAQQMADTRAQLILLGQQSETLSVGVDIAPLTSVQSFTKILDEQLRLVGRSAEEINFDNAKDSLLRLLKAAGVVLSELPKDAVDDAARKLMKIQPPAGSSGGAGRDASADVAKSLQFETEQLARTNQEQDLYNRLQQAGVALDSEKGQVIKTLTDTLWEAKAAQESMGTDKYIQEKREEIELLKLDARTRAAANAVRERENQLKSVGGSMSPEQKKAVEDVAFAKYDTEVESQKNADAAREAEQNARNFSGLIGTAFEDAILKGENFRDVIKGLVNDIALMLLRISVIKPLENALTGTLSSLPLFSSGFGLFADGGFVSGPGTSRSDSIPARLSNGEFVINADATKKHGPLLDAINSGRVLKFANGGPVGTELPALLQNPIRELGLDKPASISPVTHISINIDQGGRATSQASNDGAGENMQRLARLIEGQVNGTIARALSPGGLIWKNNKGMR